MTNGGLFLRPGERILITAIIAIALWVIVEALHRQVLLDQVGYAKQALLIALLGLVGFAYRWSARDERIASATLSAALVLAFTLILATYNYLLLPITRLSLDPWLASTNSFVGFRWNEWVETMIAYPTMASALRWTYGSTLAQIALLIVSLCWFRLWNTLDRMQATLVFSAIATVAFWGVFPSIGVAAFENISDEAASVVAPTVGREAGAELLHLIQHGADRLSPDTMTGLIAFPSFHTVLALICIRFGWDIPYLRIPFLLINLLMMPAIVIHGGHYLIDLIGGGLFFLVAKAAANRVIQALEAASRPTQPRHEDSVSPA